MLFYILIALVARAHCTVVTDFEVGDRTQPINVEKNYTIPAGLDLYLYPYQLPCQWSDSSSVYNYVRVYDADHVLIEENNPHGAKDPNAGLWVKRMNKDHDALVQFQSSCSTGYRRGLTY